MDKVLKETVEDMCRMCNTNFTIEYDNSHHICEILQSCDCGECEG